MTVLDAKLIVSRVFSSPSEVERGFFPCCLHDQGQSLGSIAVICNGQAGIDLAAQSLANVVEPVEVEP